MRVTKIPSISAKFLVPESSISPGPFKGNELSAGRAESEGNASTRQHVLARFESFSAGAFCAVFAIPPAMKPEQK